MAMDMETRLFGEFIYITQTGSYVDMTTLEKYLGYAINERRKRGASNEEIIIWLRDVSAYAIEIDDKAYVVFSVVSEKIRGLSARGGYWSVEFSLGEAWEKSGAIEHLRRDLKRMKEFGIRNGIVDLLINDGA